MRFLPFCIILIFLVITGQNCQQSLPPEISEALPQLPEEIDFNLHVKPILSDKCYQCHGPDKNSRKAKLRLDTQEGLFSVTDSLAKRKPVVPGSLAKSQIFRRVTHHDPETVMPPPTSNLSLSGKEKATLAKWIEQGAPWKAHWSLIPPEQPELPAIIQKSWPQNEIDHFVLASLEEKALKPSSPASKEVLLRRLSFDLTGLPPTIEALNAFLADESPQAYEKAVDRLLASPQYGEQFAIGWLDLARYADTHGYQADYYRSHWPWRDWVIEAFNQNISYKDFVSWQLAGDLYPAPTKAQILATGFNRNHAQNAEGGIVQEEYRVEYVADRTNTFGTAFLGLTLECARCHDHKYDPITQKEFYQVFSFFNNVDEAGQITWHFDDMPPPTVLLADEEVEAQQAFIAQKISEQEDRLKAYEAKATTNYQQWLASPKAMKVSQPVFPKGIIAYFPLDDFTHQQIPNLVEPKHTGQFIDPVTGRITNDEIVRVSGIKAKAVELNGDNALSFPDIGRFSRAQAWSIGMWVKIPADLKEGVIFHSNNGAALHTFKGYQVSVEKDHFDIRLAHSFPYNSIQLLSQTAVPRDRWIHLLLAYDGSSKAQGVHFYLDGQLLPTSIERDNLHKDIVFRAKAAGGEIIPKSHFKIGGRNRSKGLAGGQVDEVMLFNRMLTAPEVAQLANKAFEKEPPFDFYLSLFDPAYDKLLRQLENLRMEEAALIDPIPEAMVMAEMPKPRQAYVLNRGQYDLPGEAVAPGTPKAIKEFPADLPPNRLGLAQWLFQPDHPLTARVAVNRFWQHYFGQGLVQTTEDFGSQGRLPLHPQLLDWLATYFQQSGWDIKALQKKIVLSATYRQSSMADSTLIQSDPLNLLLARGPSHRLTAEQLRDQALAASGLLVDTIGGPPVKPYQPENLWAINAMSKPYQQDHGDKLYRRSLYTFWKRTNPPPAMNTFDAPFRSSCTVRRQKTNTPMQALVLLNDPQFVEAARILAERMIREGGPAINQQVTLGFRLLTSRFPNAEESDLLEKLFKESILNLNKQPHKVKALLSTGEYPSDNSLSPEKVAALTIVANAMMSMQASVMRY